MVIIQNTLALLHVILDKLLLNFALAVCIFKVVDMLLSCGANPHQTNMKGKKPTDLISTQEMSEVFNLSGVQHVAFEKKDMKACSEESTASHDVEKVCVFVEYYFNV